MASSRPSLENATVPAAAFSVCPAPALSRRLSFFHEPTSQKARRFVAPLGVVQAMEKPAAAMIFPSGEKQTEPVSKSFVRYLEGRSREFALSQSAVSHRPTKGPSPPSAKSFPSGEKTGDRACLFLCAR